MCFSLHLKAMNLKLLHNSKCEYWKHFTVKIGSGLWQCSVGVGGLIQTKMRKNLGSLLGSENLYL